MRNSGSLIRRLRMERRLSQKALCRGICAVSYLSKIEKGTANPGGEIVRLLFHALGVDYQADEGFLLETRGQLKLYFERLAYMEPDGPEREALLKVREQALHSPLTDEYTLFLVYDAMDGHQWAAAEELLNRLKYRETEMDGEALFFYALARGELTEAFEEGAAWYQKAVRLRPYAVALFLLAQHQHKHGAYQEAISTLQQAYVRAAEEGSAMVMLYASNLTAISYSDLYQEDLMLRYFRQAARLAARIEPALLPQIQYNIGATLVSMRKSAEALPYLREAEHSRPDSRLLLYHKLAIACFDTGDIQSAKRYLRKADALLKAGKGTPMEEKLIRIVRFRLEDNYLASEVYYQLLREVYGEIDKVYHHGFKQFQGNLLAEACVHSRRYKEALRIAAEVGIFPEFLE